MNWPRFIRGCVIVSVLIATLLLIGWIVKRYRTAHKPPARMASLSRPKAGGGIVRRAGPAGA